MRQNSARQFLPAVGCAHFGGGVAAPGRRQVTPRGPRGWLVTVGDAVNHSLTIAGIVDGGMFPKGVHPC